MRLISRHIMPLVINSLGSGHTHTRTHTNTHTNDPHRINFKKPGAPGLTINFNDDDADLLIISIS